MYILVCKWVTKMNLEEALKIFEIQNIYEISEKDVKKKFRDLIKVHHEDKGGNKDKSQQIIGAYNLLKEVLNNRSDKIDYNNYSSIKKNIRLNIKLLEDLFNKRELVFDSFVISRENINDYNIIIQDNLIYEINGKKYCDTIEFIWNKVDKIYNIPVYIDMSSINVSCINSMKITFDNKTITLNKIVNNVVFKFKVRNMFTINIQVSLIN